MRLVIALAALLAVACGPPDPSEPGGVTQEEVNGACDAYAAGRTLLHEQSLKAPHCGMPRYDREKCQIDPEDCSENDLANIHAMADCLNETPECREDGTFADHLCGCVTAWEVALSDSCRAGLNAPNHGPGCGGS